MGSFTKKEQIVILVIVLFITSLLGYKLFIKELITPKEKVFGLVSDISLDKHELLDAGSELIEDEKVIIMVHISGQIFNPGIVKLFQGDRLIDAIELVGGLKKDADIDRINLAKKLADEEKIYIPKIGEELGNDISSITYDTNDISESSSGKININQCTSTELEGLPGIGKVLAGRIIEYRGSNPFKNIDELKNVSGIGDKKFEGIKALITVK